MEACVVSITDRKVKKGNYVPYWNSRESQTKPEGPDTKALGCFSNQDVLEAHQMIKILSSKWASIKKPLTIV